MKTLVMYYSKTGNTKYVAEKIANEVGAELFEIKREREIKAKSGFMLYFRGGFQSMSKRKSKLKAINIDFKEYDLIFLGFPVWAWNVHPAIRGLTNDYTFTGNKFALFCSCADNGKKQLDETEKLLKGSTILGKIDFVEPLKNKPEEQSKRAVEWAKEMVKKAKK